MLKTRLARPILVDDEDLEHHHRIEGWPTALRSLRVGQCPTQLAAEYLEIHRRLEALELIAEIA